MGGNGSAGEVSPGDLRDIQGFLMIQIPTWLWIILAVIVLALVTWLFFKYVFKPQAKPVVTLFEKTLNQLRELNLNSDSKSFYINYSEIVRLYLEERLQISVLDKTADEIKPLLVSESRILTNNAIALANIFTRADLAKFAKQEISTEERKRDIDETIQLLTAIEDLMKIEEQKALQPKLEEIKQ